MAVSVVRETLDLGRYAASITGPSGNTQRWGPDEVDAGNLLQDLQYSSSAPGGFRDMSCSLLRNLAPRADEVLFSTIRIYGPGGQVMWEGRLQGAPRQTGQGTTVNPQAIGWQKHLEDNGGFREVYVDRDPSSWQPPPIERRINLAQNNQVFDQDFTVSQSGPGFVVNGTTGKAIPAGSRTELWYTAPANVRVQALQYRLRTFNRSANITLPYFEAWTTRSQSSGQLSPALIGDDTRQQYLFKLGGGRYMALNAAIESGTETPTAPYSAMFKYVAVYGSHGLTLWPTVPGDTLNPYEPYGVRASDVVANVVERMAPLLRFTDGMDGTVQPTTYAIPHLVFGEPTTANVVIESVNKYHNWNWAVWEDRTFHYGPAGSGTLWQARRADGASLSLEGDSADDIYSHAMVTWQDVDGTTKIAGWPGGNFDVESSDLQAADLSSVPSYANGIPVKTLAVSLSYMTDYDGAVLAGAAAFAEANLAKRKGTMTLNGMVRNAASGQMRPVGEVRADDSIQFLDEPGQTVRRVDECTYSHSGRTAQLGCNGPLSRVESMFERQAAFGNFYGTVG